MHSLETLVAALFEQVELLLRHRKGRRKDRRCRPDTQPFPPGRGIDFDPAFGSALDDSAAGVNAKMTAAIAEEGNLPQVKHDRVSQNPRTTDQAVPNPNIAVPHGAIRGLQEVTESRQVFLRPDLRSQKPEGNAGNEEAHRHCKPHDALMS